MSDTNVLNEGSRDVTLDSLLLPGTPESVRQLYYQLEDRAKTADFDLLEDDIVVLDTETTGLSFRDCELIEIAAARLSGRDVVERYHTFVHPGRPIPPEIQRLTNITDLDVTDAPSPKDAVAGLAEFVGGSPILAHNATFDRTFVEKAPGGHEVSDLWIDTLALSRIALPRLKSHRLADMAKAFHCDSVTHRAMDDVNALCGMWRIILLGLTQLPQGLLAYLAGMHEDVSWAFRPVLSHLAASQPDASFSLKAVRHALVADVPLKRRNDAGSEDLTLECPSPQEVSDAFSDNGVVSRMYQRYESRPEQVQMALEVRDALDTSTHRAIEAGTGVGKTIAYLLPEVLFAQRNNVTVGIATKTNALTDQLVSQELPALNDVLPQGVSFYSLKGYDHYPCLHRMDRAAREDLPLSQEDSGISANTAASDMLTALAVCYAYACQSPEGDVDALGIRWKAVPRPMLTTSSSECLRGRCPYYPNECFVHGARRRAASADVVVTNHSLLLRNIAADNAILPPIRHWVVDEAHGFQSEARRQWALEVSGEASREAFETLGGTKSGAIHSLMVRCATTEAATLTVGLLTKAAASVSRASVAMGDFFTQMHELVALADRGGDYDGVTLWIDEEVRKKDEWKELASIGNDCVEKLDEAVRFLDDASKAIEGASPQLAGELSESTQALRDLLEALRLILDGSDSSYVYSAQLNRHKKRMAQEKLVAEKLDIGSDLATRWYPEMKSVVFTSATMAIGKSFDHFNHEVGFDTLDKDQYKDVALRSSYDFDNHMAVVVTKDMPQPNDRRYLPALADLLYDVHVAMDGSVLTLFTNRREMERVYEALSPRLAQRGLDLVMQGRRSSPRRLREQFLENKRTSLFALKSFWEGFDAAGDTLRCVVIPKLPFSSPKDPIVRERDKREDRAWWRYSLPEAVISVKQAAGRLIRTADDTGVLVLADSRLVQKRYGKQFISSLPSRSCVTMEHANVGRYITMWRSSKEGR